MSLLNTAIGIFTVANPIGNLPIYLSFTDGDQKTDKAIARNSAFTFLIALLLATWLGNDLLAIFGISQGAFQISGGLIVILIGLSMLRPNHQRRTMTQPRLIGTRVLQGKESCLSAFPFLEALAH